MHLLVDDLAVGHGFDADIHFGPGAGCDYVAAGSAADDSGIYAESALRVGEGVRAWPTLAGLMGRRIATAPGYSFSPALKKLDIVWTPETVAKLFELGPATYTPGTKMPEQKITSAADRAALVQFLEKATK